jgi:hypothetical protein
MQMMGGCEVRPRRKLGFNWKQRNSFLAYGLKNLVLVGSYNIFLDSLSAIAPILIEFALAAQDHVPSAP